VSLCTERSTPPLSLPLSVTKLTLTVSTLSNASVPTTVGFTLIAALRAAVPPMRHCTMVESSMPKWFLLKTNSSALPTR